MTHQVPPVAAIGNAQQFIVAQPAGLQVGKTVCDDSAACYIAAFRQRHYFQCGVVPGHVGMMPFEKGQLPAIRRQCGRAAEIRAFRQHRQLSGLQRDGGEKIAGFRFTMLFGDHDQPLSCGVQFEIGNRHLPGCKKLSRRRQVERNMPDRLVAAIHEKDAFRCHAIRAAAITVHFRLHAERRWREIDGCTVRPFHQYGAALFLRPCFQPVHIAVVQLRFRQAQ